MPPSEIPSFPNDQYMNDDFSKTFESFINPDFLFEMSQDNNTQIPQVPSAQLAPSQVDSPFGFSINQQNDCFVDFNSMSVDPSELNMNSHPRSESPIDVCSLGESVPMEIDDVNASDLTIPTPFLKNLPLHNPTVAKLKSEDSNATYGINSFNNTKIRHTKAQASKPKEQPTPIEAQPKASKPYKVRNTSSNKVKTEEKTPSLDSQADISLTPEEIEMLANLNPKERRQIRNKISARNFRVRRKEYISTLESKVEQQDHEIDELKEYIYSVQNENQALKEEVDDLRAKFNQLSLSYQSLSNSTFINNHSNMDSFNSSLSELTSVPSSRGSSPILTDKDRLGQNCGRESRLAAFRSSTFDKSKHEADSNLPFLQRSMDVCFPV